MTRTLPPPPRVLSVDVFRGLTIALMILVNDPGDRTKVYPHLAHAEWNGYTAADLVFPNFLFLAGASLVFSLQSRIQRANRGQGSRLTLTRGLAKRSLNLLALKLVIALIPTFRLRRIRIFGVLFRSAVLSFAAGLILLATLSVSALLGVTAAILAAYYVALRFVPIPGLGRPVRDQPLLDPDNNLAAWLDRRVARLLNRQLHSGALYNVTHDPEGLLSTLPALGTTLIGACAALVLRSPHRTPQQKAATLAISGAASLAAGHAWHRTFPINKNLWTSSYVLVSAGWSLLGLATLYWLYDIRHIERRSPATRALTRPANIFGANAVVAYAIAIVGAKMIRLIRIRRDDHTISLRTHAYRSIFARKHSTPLRSAAFAVTYAALCFLPNLFLWRRKLFIKI